MNTYADAAELASNELKKNGTAIESKWKAAETKSALTRFFHEELIPEVKRAVEEINTTHFRLRAHWVLFPNEQFPQSIELLLVEPRMKFENYLSFRMESDLSGAWIFWNTSDNPICKKIEEPRLELIEELIVKFIGAVFNRAASAALV